MSFNLERIRDTGVSCPNCQNGSILDQRANSFTKDTPYWICNNSLSFCNYTEKFNKKWQWASWEWDTPYFIKINEDSVYKNQREIYENELLLEEKRLSQNAEIDKKINDLIKYCRLCGLRNCETINNCL